MSNRIFLKALAAFVFVIGAATLTLDFSIRHTWENSLRSDIESARGSCTRFFELPEGADGELRLMSQASSYGAHLTPAWLENLQKSTVRISTGGHLKGLGAAGHG